MNIKDKVVLITGASRGLGVGIANEFAGHGSRLCLAARSKDELEGVRKTIERGGAEAIAIVADVSDPTSLESLVGETLQRLGPIDVLVNNAGIESVCEFEDMSAELAARIIEVNVKGLIWLTRLVAPEMVQRRSGHIVNIASMAGLLPVPHNTVYSASKHAVVGFSRSLRLELGDHGVGVSVVCPGFVRAGMFATWGRRAPSSAGSVSSEDVARATVSAVINNSAEVKVNKTFGKFGPTVHAISPRLSGFLMSKTGVSAFLREQAALNAKRESDPRQ